MIVIWQKKSKVPVGKVESLFHLRHEDGSVQFFPTPYPSCICPRLCGET